MEMPRATSPTERSMRLILSTRFPGGPPLGVPAVINSFVVPSCMPSGVAMGPGTDVLVTCAGHDGRQFAPTTYIINGTTGAIVSTINFVGGVDQGWFNPGDGKYYEAARDMLPSSGPRRDRRQAEAMAAERAHERQCAQRRRRSDQQSRLRASARRRALPVASSRRLRRRLRISVVAKQTCSESEARIHSLGFGLPHLCGGITYFTSVSW